MPGVAATEETIRANLGRIHKRIAAAAQRAGRKPDTVRLIPVTKTVGETEIRTLIGMGYTELAENRVETAQPKIEAFAGQARWHMVGRIQRRKARDVVALFDRVDSVDRLSLAEELERRCAAAGKTMPILLQVNTSGEEVKAGFAPGEAEDALAQLRGGMPHLKVEGLMTMAPLVDNPEETRPVFAGLRKLGERLGLTTLSMGMSNDFEVAVEEGATEVRIGTAIFKAA